METEYLHIAEEQLKKYKPVSLSQMDQVKLMDRIDSKFILTFKDLIPVLEKLACHYYVLTINNKQVFSYKTEYYDTPDLEMFTDHHNGKLNRYKIRHREYIESDIRFLEVKFKSNKGRVIKDRIELKTGTDLDFGQFISQHTPYNPGLLQVALINQFNRFTLVDYEMRERVTIDFNLNFSDRNDQMSLKGLVIIEVKQNKNSRESSIYSILKETGIRPDSFSKYCLGIALLNRHKKFNNFKRTINLINKLNHVELSA